MTLHFSAIWPQMGFILGGVVVTLQYTVLSVIFGFFLGTLLALMRLSKLRFLSFFSRCYVSIFRGTPLIVQLSLIYFATPQLTGYRIGAMEAGILAFSLNSGAYVSEIMGAGIKSVDRGQFEAASSLGISYILCMRDIILPQALKTILPALVNEMINLLKESAIISMIGEMDLLRRATIVSSTTYVYFEPLLVVAVIYYILVTLLSYLAGLLEKRMGSRV